MSDESILSFKATNKLLEGTTNADVRYSNFKHASRDFVIDSRVNENKVAMKLNVTIVIGEVASRTSSRERGGGRRGGPVEDVINYKSVVNAVIFICCVAILFALRAVLR